MTIKFVGRRQDTTLKRSFTLIFRTLGISTAWATSGILLIFISLIAVVVTIWITQGLFVAARLAGLEKERRRVPIDA